MLRALGILACVTAFAAATAAVRAEGTWPPPDHFTKASADPGGTGRTAVRRAGVERQPGASRKAAEARKDKEKDEKGRPRLPPSNGPWRWRVSRSHWTAEDEGGFEELIRRIGESDCATVHDCLTSAAANPRFHDRHPPRMQFFADCADLPFTLRAYYAWQMGLPFSFPLRLGSHPRSLGHKSFLQGNQTVERYDIVGPGPDPRLVLPAINTFVTSEHFRAPPAYAGKILNDHYPVRISRESIRPGTVIFDPDGHVAIVYEVTGDGRVLYIDAHPDNSLTRGVFNREFGRAEPPMGAGFKRWRPQRLVGARPGPDGTLIGGRIVLTPDRELPDWSDEQFFGNRSPRPALWSDGQFVIDGEPMQLHEYVRLRLAHPGFRYNPVEEVRAIIRQICRELRYRGASVDLAIRAGLDKRPQPDRLPRNIFATSGDWETYSTPSRDARIKSAFEELRDEVERFLDLARDGSSILDYAGADLRSDLKAVHGEETAACSVTYTASDGSRRTLGWQEIERRLFKLSFDPHHCIERRWGADSAEELRTCADDSDKSAWYAAQHRLRNQLVRTYGEQMGWTLAELQNRELDIGIDEAPDLDVRKVLDSVGDAAEPVAAVGPQPRLQGDAARRCAPGDTRRRNRAVRRCAN